MSAMYGSLAKCVVSRVIRSGVRREGQHLLPNEDTAVFSNNRKLTRDLVKAVWYEVGKEKLKNISFLKNFGRTNKLTKWTGIGCS